MTETERKLIHEAADVFLSVLEKYNQGRPCVMLYATTDENMDAIAYSNFNAMKTVDLAHMMFCINCAVVDMYDNGKE